MCPRKVRCKGKRDNFLGPVRVGSCDNVRGWKEKEKGLRTLFQSLDMSSFLNLSTDKLLSQVPGDPAYIYRQEEIGGGVTHTTN